MRPYINSFIQTLSKRRSERVGFLLEEAHASKEDLATLKERLRRTVADGSTLSSLKHREEARIRPEVLYENIRRVDDGISELYDVSNNVSLLLNTHKSLLPADVKAIEDELSSMEKAINNFSFLLSDNQAYDYAYLESFTDELGRDEELTEIPDRSALPFGSADQANIHTDEGVLSLPEMDMSTHPMNVIIADGNVLGFTTSQTNVNNLLAAGSSSGWTMRMAAPGPINAPIKNAQGRAGAQVALEFRIAEPSPCSHIKLSPNADMPVELIQITTYEDDEAEGKDRLSKPIYLNRPYTVYFPLESISRFVVVVGQPVFHRVNKHEDVLEFRYQRLIESINKKNENNQSVYKRIHFIKNVEQAILLEAIGEGHQSVSIPRTDMQKHYGAMSPEKTIFAFRFDRPSFWREDFQDDSYILFNMLHDSDSSKIRRDTTELASKTRTLSEGEPISQVANKRLDNLNVESGFTYYYNIGLHYVRVGVESPGFKGVFVSRALPAPGDIGAVRIKTEDTNYFEPNSPRHSAKLTSIEYSVSDKSDPRNETDWKPILPVGTRVVHGERVFLDDDGNADFRFRASTDEQILIYRNGYAMSFEEDVLQLVLGAPGSASGIKVNPTLITPEDVFTCDYAPVLDETVVSFTDDSYYDPPLVPAFDETGSGERFLSTADRNTITLASIPYIDPVLSKSSSTYQPIIVQLTDGSVAQNLTDYKAGTLPSLPADGYYYIHSGNTLMFNRPLENFRVFYQYLENNVRFRVVLRCNSKDFVSPSVDFVHLKAKTRNPDIS